jgi:hypothetical protein
MAAIQAKLVERQMVDVERNSWRKILFRRVSNGRLRREGRLCRSVPSAIQGRSGIHSRFPAFLVREVILQRLTSTSSGRGVFITDLVGELEAIRSPDEVERGL